MLKHTIAAGVLTLSLAAPALAQSTATTVQPTATNPTMLSAVQACEAQTHRMAGLNKGLAANYNAARVHDDCVAANGGSSTDVASNK
jgi:hypothetical protein